MSIAQFTHENSNEPDDTTQDCADNRSDGCEYRCDEQRPTKGDSGRRCWQDNDKSRDYSAGNGTDQSVNEKAASHS